MGGIRGDGYTTKTNQAQGSPHTDNEAFQGLDILRAAQVCYSRWRYVQFACTGCWCPLSKVAACTDLMMSCVASHIEAHRVGRGVAGLGVKCLTEGPQLDPGAFSCGSG